MKSTPLLEDWHIGTSLFGHQYTTDDVKQLTQQQLPNFFRTNINISSLISSKVKTRISAPKLQTTTKHRGSPQKTSKTSHITDFLLDGSGPIDHIPKKSPKPILKIPSASKPASGKIGFSIDPAVPKAPTPVPSPVPPPTHQQKL